VKKTAIAFVLSLAAVAAVSAAAEKTVTVTGVVQTYSAVAHAFTLKSDAGETVSLVWTKDTKFNGVVAQGARVTVRFTPEPAGANVAQTVGVLK
jgi:P pilus assembly chaperone PapD